MFKNFFVLNRHVREMNNLLTNLTLVEAFTQQKDKLVLCLQNNDKHFYIEINTDHLLPYFILKEHYSRAKKNSLSFFNSFLPSKIISVNIANFDRIIQIKVNGASIYFYIHGKDTNVFLIDDELRIESFKKILDTEKIMEEIKDLSFTNAFQIPAINFDSGPLSASQLSKKYQYIGKEIANELSRREEEIPGKGVEQILLNILEDIKTNRPYVYFDEESNENKMAFFYREELNYCGQVFFENVNDAMKYYIAEQNRRALDNQFHKNIQNKFEKIIAQLEKKIEHLQKRINEGCKDKLYSQTAILLQLNVNKIKKGSTNIALINTYESDKIINIKLIPSLSPRENIDYYYDKAKSERKEFDKLQAVLSTTKEELNKQKMLYDKAKEGLGGDVDFKYQTGKKEITNRLQDPRFNFRQFVLYEKYLIYVGKNSKNNDELTTGFAKQNDYWFHARSVSGSHVVLRWDKSFGEIQKSILEKAASIAAFYSKAKTSGLVPVSYTQKKYVIKKKGMAPGKVALLKEKVLIVKPEIPKECKNITE